MQREIEDFAAAERVRPRKPIDDHGRLVARRPDLREGDLIGHDHAMRRDHAFGLAGRPAREEDLRDGVERNALRRRFDRPRRTAFERRDIGHAREAGDRKPEIRLRERCIDVGERRIHRGGEPREPRGVDAGTRVLRWNGCDGNTDVQCGQRHEAACNAVGRNDQERPLRRRAEFEQPRCDRSNAPQRVAVA